jgi:hypothetical protein
LRTHAATKITRHFKGYGNNNGSVFRILHHYGNSIDQHLIGSMLEYHSIASSYFSSISYLQDLQD